jgi:hypothetical protein
MMCFMATNYNQGARLYAISSHVCVEIWVGKPLCVTSSWKSTASTPPGERTLGNAAHRGADRKLDRP